MRIAFLTPEFPHPKMGASGGIGTSIFNLSKGLTALGHEIFILVYGQNEDAVFTEEHIHYHRIKNVKLKGFSRLLTQKKIQNKINDLVKNKGLDIVEAPDWTGITSGIKVNCPVVVRLHGSDTYFCHLDRRPVKAINKRREKAALKRANGLLSVSQYTANVTQEIFSLARPFTIIPNGVDLKHFTVESNGSTDPNTILYFGTLIRKKGLLELPLIFNEVYKANQEAKLIIIGRDAADIQTGNTSVWSMMQPLFDQEAFQNVSYLGSVSYEDMKEHISRASVCVFPTFAEALPVSWIESMAIQKAVVASDIGWASEIITDGQDGFLVHPKAHAIFAQKIITLLSDDSLRNQFGIAARHKVEQKFSLQVVASQSAAYYQQLLSATD